MARQKKWHNYVLVMTNNGPIFVTRVCWRDKTAEWDKNETPLEFDDVKTAEDLVLGLNLNFHVAFLVHQAFIIDHQPYNYKAWHITWEKNEEEDEGAV